MGIDSVLARPLLQAWEYTQPRGISTSGKYRYLGVLTMSQQNPGRKTEGAAEQRPFNLFWYYFPISSPLAATDLSTFRAVTLAE